MQRSDGFNGMILVHGAALLLYRLFVSFAAPYMALRLLLRRMMGRGDAASVAERLGTAPGLAGPLIWLHAASNGELASARALIEGVLRRDTSVRLLITTNTETGRALARSWRLPRTHAALAPLDHRLVLRRFLARTRPAVLVVVENELWPNRLTACAARAIPVVVVGARMSARSARRWGWMPGLAGSLLGAITALSAQDAGSEVRFAKLGLPADRLLPITNLKTAPDATPPPEVAALRPHFPRATTVLAASTHEGEEEPVLAAFAQALKTNPARRLILAPRHPRRAAEIAALIARTGLHHTTRSNGESPGDAPVYLADTMGEMAIWYALAGITFVGGSLVDRGGHTPYEPAAFGSAIVHGPHVSNFHAAFDALDAAEAALPVTAPSLAAALEALADPARQTTMASTAHKVLDKGTDLDPLLDAIFSPSCGKAPSDDAHPTRT
ncbi:3-deoxy-D-manno-octulosonic acid transferase [Phaeovulum sp.]|uniref:3-deoxy-D-manno-octulosonic acid transferase n=1 Tax=Phaeovulum sp. TaxID=2934796 RepID=UPI0039E2EE1D